MAYYFECDTCNKKQVFSDDANKTKFQDYASNKLIQIFEGKKQDYETVICKSCISKKIRLKGNYIII